MNAFAQWEMPPDKAKRTLLMHDWLSGVDRRHRHHDNLSAKLHPQKRAAAGGQCRGRQVPRGVHSYPQRCTSNWFRRLSQALPVIPVKTGIQAD